MASRAQLNRPRGLPGWYDPARLRVLAALMAAGPHHIIDAATFTEAAAIDDRFILHHRNLMVTEGLIEVATPNRVDLADWYAKITAKGRMLAGTAA